MGLTTLLCSSCIVSQRKYDLCDAERLAALTSRDSLASLLDVARTDNNMLKGEQAMMTSKNATLTNAIATRERDNEEMSKELERMKNDSLLMQRKLKTAQNRLSANSDMNDSLTAELNAKIAELEAYQKRLNINASENDSLSSQLNTKLKELQDREATIEKLQGIINDQNTRVKGILDGVQSALKGFNSDQLTVREEGGKVYVAMSEKLLFQSGKATVNKEGQIALGKLAEVLNRQTDVDITIEGHTDSKPIKTAQFADNWDLSVIRATSVVRILTETYKVNPLQILPCGRGEYRPVDTNETNDGRARNRRTEIIISPKLDKIYDIITAKEG